MSASEQPTPPAKPAIRKSFVVIVGGIFLVIAAAVIFLRGGVTVSAAGVTTSVEACNQAVSRLNSQMTALSAPSVSWRAVEEAKRQATDAETTCAALAQSTRGAVDPAVQDSYQNIKKLAAQLAKAQHANIKVFANQEWQAAGISAVGGDLLFVTATGQWSISGPLSAPKYGVTGPDGYEKNPSWGASIYGGRIGSLAMAVTNDARPSRAFTGTGKFMAPSGGPVRFRCNDDGVNNNDGYLDVELVVMPSLQ